MPTVREPVVVPPAPTFADPAEADPSAGTGTAAESLLPTAEALAALSPAELVAWAGQPVRVALPAAGTWRSLSVGLQLSADPAGGARLEGLEADLLVETPEGVDALVAQQVAAPPPGTSVLDVVEADDDGRRTVSVLLRTAGASADSVDVVARPEGGSLLHVQHLPRRDDGGPDLTEERVLGLVERLTAGSAPPDWPTRFARLTLVQGAAPVVMVAWSAPGLDVAAATAAARAAFPHLVLEPEVPGPHRTTADFTSPSLGAGGLLSVSTESDGTTRVELEARG
ncbi:hypothetical protein [Cellulomonas endophytica]|uniref:hypothetical protein n=1 Tax=Cellulomonas endophytica TaxID=2494735 RepID=UPI0013E98664|nr:hypothetical protein [Cellulomonas endophytica]